MKTLNTLLAEADNSSIAYRMGFRSGSEHAARLLGGRAADLCFQTAAATSVVWLAIFGLALVMLS